MVQLHPRQGRAQTRLAASWAFLSLVATAAIAHADGESCETTSDCGSELHCIAGTCRDLRPKPLITTPGVDQGAVISISVAGDHGELQHKSSRTAPWATLCMAPCAVQGPRADLYRIKGSATASPGIRLQTPDHNVLLQATVGQPADAALAAGIIGTVIAGSGVVMGVVAFTGALSAFCILCETTTPSWVGPLAVTGLVVGLVGVVVLSAGFTSWRTSRYTRLREVRQFVDVAQERTSKTLPPVIGLTPITIRF